MEVLPLWRDAVGVFYRPSPLAYTQVKTFSLPYHLFRDGMEKRSIHAFLKGIWVKLSFLTSILFLTIITIIYEWGNIQELQPIVRGEFNKFPDFFVQIFKIVVDSWKFTVIARHLMRWLTNFYDFRFKWTATAGIGIHPTTPKKIQTRWQGRKLIDFIMQCTWKTKFLGTSSCCILISMHAKS